MSKLSEFNKCTIKQKHRCGRTVISCKIGLWGVDAPTYELAMREAMHYFKQYRGDGEYYKILGGKSPVELLMENTST